ncbi:MAG: hypothetical protein JSR82_24990 [Verrucomicrobia bacterium]|nr:hypothetical protein [Verrucomicrobiota bacterium]
MKGKLLSPSVARIDHDHHHILFEGEKLKYTERRMGVLQKKRTGALALFLGVNRGPFIAVQPLLADGQLVEPERVWSRATSWDFVGEIDRCVGWRDPNVVRRRKRDAFANLFRRLVGKQPKRRLIPIVEWTENYRPWPKAEHRPGTQWQEVISRWPAPTPPAEEKKKPAARKKSGA